MLYHKPFAYKFGLSSTWQKMKIARAGRLMRMSPLYPCGKLCSKGTHNETLKNLALFSSIINGIMMESRLRISVLLECLQFFNRIENSLTFTL